MYVNQVTQHNLFKSLLILSTLFIPALFIEPSPEAELVNLLWKILENPEYSSSFGKIQGEFGEKLLSYLSRVRFGSGPGNPRYWTNYILSLVVNTFDSFFDMGSKCVYFDTGKIKNVEGDYVILGMEDKNEVQYKAFHVINRGRMRERNEDKPRIKDGTFEANLEEPLKAEFKTKITRHFNQLLSEKDDTTQLSLAIARAEIYKIDLTLYEEATKKRKKRRVLSGPIGNDSHGP